MSQRSFTTELDRMVTNFNSVYYSTVYDESQQYELALRQLWQIVSYMIHTINAVIDDPVRAYPVLGSMRLILECLSDAKYLSLHKEEAKEYRLNQDKIATELNAHEDKFIPFVNGTLSSYGQLKEVGIMKRIRKYLGKDYQGDYNFYCFYTHPNIAPLSWLNYLGSEPMVQHSLQTLAMYLSTFLELIPNPYIDEVSMIELGSKILELSNTELSVLTYED